MLGESTKGKKRGLCEGMLKIKCVFSWKCPWITQYHIKWINITSLRQRKIGFLVNIYSITINIIEFSLCMCLGDSLLLHGGATLQIRYGTLTTSQEVVTSPSDASFLALWNLPKLLSYLDKRNIWEKGEDYNREVKFLFQCGSLLDLIFGLPSHAHLPWNDSRWLPYRKWSELTHLSAIKYFYSRIRTHCRSQNQIRFSLPTAQCLSGYQGYWHNCQRLKRGIQRNHFSS